MSRRAARGQLAERRVFDWLCRRGFVPVASNFRCRFGELDLIMLDGETLAVIEVRSRTSAAYVAPALSVDGRKQAKIIRSAEYFCARNAQYADLPVRFDVAAVTGDDDATLEYIADAFQADD